MFQLVVMNVHDLSFVDDRLKQLAKADNGALRLARPGQVIKNSLPAPSAEAFEPAIKKKDVHERSKGEPSSCSLSGIVIR